MGIGQNKVSIILVWTEEIIHKHLIVMHVAQIAD